MEILHKIWDSDFFKTKIAEVSIVGAKIDIDIFKLKSKEYNLIYVNSDSYLQEFDGYFMDEKIIFEKNLVKTYDVKNEIIELINPTSIETEILYRLAILSGKYSRYNRDNKFSKDMFVKLYETWINNTLSKTFGYKLFVIYKEKQIAGFITINKIDVKTMEIGLISVFENYQGLGLAKDMINYVCNYCFNNGYTILTVATQKINTPAMKLYTNSGFELKKITKIYHIWN